MAGPAKVQVITAYVDLGLVKRSSGEFHMLGQQMIDAAGPTRVRCFDDFPLADCWAYEEYGYRYPPANPTAPDRFVDVREHTRSNLIQHSPVQWVEIAAAQNKVPDVFVWIGYSVMKQGAFTGRPVTHDAIREFRQKVENYHYADIPIPSIRPYDKVEPFGNNWQVVGSTIIMPRKWLPAIAHHYRMQLRLFVQRHQAIPLDLAIWPAVVEKSGLPWRYYPAEYDATQFTNFPG